MFTTRTLWVCAVLLVVASCGGGSAGRDTGVGGSGTATGTPGRVVGTFQGVGSILVNDRRLTTTGANFEIEDGGASENDLREGQYLEVFADLDTNEADRVIYRADIKGPVTAINIIDPLTAAAELTILGQSVATNSVTRFDGVTLDTLVVGAELEISGSPSANGDLVATFVELKSSLTEYKVVGTITNLDSGGMTFQIGGLTVDYSAASLQEFGSTAIGDGQRVEVKIPTADFTAPASGVATTVELLTAEDFEEGEEVEYEGFVSRFASATDFDVAGLAVTTNSNTVFVEGTSASLGLNVKVEVEGTINSAGVLVAERVILKSTGAVRVEGTVSSVDESAGTVTTDVGLTFTVRTLTELEDDRDDVEPFSLADLQAGDYVEVRGFLDGEVLVAAELERDDFDTRTRMRGPVTDEDAAAGSVDILGVEVVGVAGQTNYDSTQADFHAAVEIGTFVEAEWDPFSSTSDTADELSIEDD